MTFTFGDVSYFLFQQQHAFAAISSMDVERWVWIGGPYGEHTGKITGIWGAYE